MIERLKSLLGLPVVYKTFARAVGRERLFTMLVRGYIRPRPGDKVLDIGCGPAVLLERMPEVNYTGFDLSPDYIESAKKQFGSRARFFCEAVSKASVPEPGTYDLVLANGVVHHLPDAEAVQLFELAHAALKTGGRLVTVDGCYEDGQSPITRRILENDRGEYVRTRAEYERLAAQVFPTRKVTVRHDLLRIPYTHIIMECTATPRAGGG
jgi:SAM-dependent methyltransferase